MHCWSGDGVGRAIIYLGGVVKRQQIYCENRDTGIAFWLSGIVGKFFAVLSIGFLAQMSYTGDKY